MRISIALCTYNGERYLRAQLESIASQTRSADELVVCDDRSTDATGQIVQDFAARAPLSVTFSTNPVNLGSTRNFSRAIELCQGDVIVLADQDDVWKANKLEQLSALLGDERIGMAFSNADVVDPELRPLGYTLWDGLPDGDRVLRAVDEQRLFERLLRGNVVTGATLAFRARYKDLVLPIPPSWVHDEWIALLISAVAPYRATPQRLIFYRQHSTQQIGARRFSLRGVAGQALRGTLKRLDLDALARDLDATAGRLETAPAFAEAQQRIADLRAKAAHFRIRSRSRAGLAGRVPLIARELCTGRYHRYSLGWLTVARDLIAV